MELTESKSEALLRLLFAAAIRSVDGYNATAKAVQEKLAMSDDLLARDRPTHIVAIGKAADAMARGAASVLGSRVCVGLVITKHEHASEELQGDKRFTVIESGHPTPDEHSLHAGEQLISAVSHVPDNEHLLFLVSGGASALVESLVNPLLLEDLTPLTEQLLSRGLAIGEINRIRRSVSRIKGGKLASFLSQCDVTQMLISDVPGDVLGDIGSGPLVFDASPVESPQFVGKPIASALAPDASDAVWQRIDTSIIASSAIAQAAVVAEASRLGVSVQQKNGSLDGALPEILHAIVSTLQAATSLEGLYVWGGETTVALPDNPGRGGRNQHLALCLAQAIQGGEKISALCVGTDGTDGPTADAGGLVDETTVQKGQAAQLDCNDSLQAADAGNYLEQTNSLFTTGPTGTNVMDLVIAYKGEFVAL